MSENNPFPLLDLRMIDRARRSDLTVITTANVDGARDSLMGQAFARLKRGDGQAFELVERNCDTGASRVVVNGGFRELCQWRAAKLGWEPLKDGRWFLEVGTFEKPSWLVAGNAAEAIDKHHRHFLDDEAMEVADELEAT